MRARVKQCSGARFCEGLKPEPTHMLRAQIQIYTFMYCTYLCIYQLRNCLMFCFVLFNINPRPVTGAKTVLIRLSRSRIKYGLLRTTELRDLQI